MLSCSSNFLRKIDYYHIKFAQTLGHVTAIRDHETGDHNIRVAYLSSILGEKMELNIRNLRSLMKGAFLHDIGKIGIPDKILLKNTSLDKDEWIIMKKHPAMGVEIISELEWFGDAKDVILYHYERFDGSGYPVGLAKEKIPLNARIFAVIDVFDALCSKRPYKESFDFDKAFKIIENDKNKHFDAMIVDIFLKYRDIFRDLIKLNNSNMIREKLQLKRKEIFNV